ncbi:unnamed protein product [Hymenolepis diminuta]|uniref:Tetraspanin n=1 Tax=Hymenolepis diminuta TaxID=6216 RepID=A0A564Y7J0_HYMDI|nr:unnamed protein product [Hymenolepis diminuta]
MFKSSINRVLCVLYTQILFFGSLICMGLVLITGSVVSISNKYWNCTVLNIYYTDAWLCLVIGIVQVLLGTGLGLYVYLQPKCAKKDHLVLVGPEGNQLGEIAAQRVQNTSSRYWTLQISPNHQKSGNNCCSRLSQCRCSSCFCGNDESNQSALTNVALWFRPSAIVFLLILAAHIAAILLTASLIAQAQRTDAGLSSEVENIFIEAKSVLIRNNKPIVTSAAAKCWDQLEPRRRCCGVDGPADWLLENSTKIGRRNNELDWIKQQCSCSKIETGICETMTFDVSSDKLQSITVYARGCRDVIRGEILHDLQVLRILIPLSFCIIFFTCLFCIYVTLRVAYLEMGNEDILSPNQSIENNNASSDSLRRSFISALPNPARAPNRLSYVTGPALHSLSLDAVMCQGVSSPISK